MLSALEITSVRRSASAITSASSTRRGARRARPGRSGPVLPPLRASRCRRPARRPPGRRRPPRRARLPRRCGRGAREGRSVEPLSPALLRACRRRSRVERSRGLEALDRRASHARAGTRSAPARSRSTARSRASSASATAVVEGPRASSTAASDAARSPARSATLARGPRISAASPRRLVGRGGVAVVGGDHLCDLVRVDARPPRRGSAPPRGGALAIAARERLVGDPLDERLQEAVLAHARGSARRCRRTRSSLRTRPTRARSTARLVEAGERREPTGRERLAEHGCVLRAAGAPRRRGRRGAPRSARAASRARRARRASPTTCVAAVAGLEQRRGRAACGRSRRRRAGSRPRARGSRASVLVGEARARARAAARPSPRRRAARARATWRCGRRDPKPGWRSTSSGRASVSTRIGSAARPLEQVLEEVDQRRVGPLEVLERRGSPGPARPSARRRAARPRRGPRGRARRAR